MKTKSCWLALIVSAAMIAPAHADHHNNSASHVSSSSSSRTRSGPVSSYRSMPMRNFGGYGRVYSSQRFPVGVRSQMSTNFHPQLASSNPNIGARRFTGESLQRDNRLNQFSNNKSQLKANTIRNGSNANQIRNGNNLPSSWRNHVVAQHSANQHPDWDR